MGECLAAGNVAVALLANTLATGAMLVALILAFGPVSGAHLNPAVTLADAWQGGLKGSEAPGYVAAQMVGAFAGVAMAHAMFGEAVFSASRHARAGAAQMFSEFVATFGLLAVTWGCAGTRMGTVPFAVGAYNFAGSGPRMCPGLSWRKWRTRLRLQSCFDGWSRLNRPFRQRRRGVGDRKRVLILCTGNSARSQMAEGLLRHDAPEIDVESAGTRPSFVRPEAIAAMREVGIDISGHRSKSVDEFEGQRFDTVITVCDNARENCPVFFGDAQKLHHSFEDPAAVEGPEEERLAAFRRVRDELRIYFSKTFTVTVHRGFNPA